MPRIIFPYFLFFTLLCWLTDCRFLHRPPRHDLTPIGENLDNRVQDNIRMQLQYGLASRTGSAGTFSQYRLTALERLYSQRDYKALWSENGYLNIPAHTLLSQVEGADAVGLDPADYFEASLKALIPATNRKIARRDAAGWARADILLSEACLKLFVQVHFGVLGPDSLSLRKQNTFSDTSLALMVSRGVQNNILDSMIDSLEPRYIQFGLLKSALSRYILQNGKRVWDSLPLNKLDSSGFPDLVASRLVQGGELDTADIRHQARIIRALKRFQRTHNLYPDGQAGSQTVEALNVTAGARIRQIRINLERWREMPDTLPSCYALVNIPAFGFQLWDNDTLRLQSRVIVGAPLTPTPQLNSSILNFQLFPYWRLPMSIVVKEVLPGIKKNKEYLRKFNLQVLDRHNRIVDSSALHWNRYSKNYFPYLIRQMTGLDNSLGIIKFNFRNKYSVYMHDTNARGLFGRQYRALSHGCVRLQQWDSLSRYLVRNDKLRHIEDSLVVWEKLQVQKQVSLTRRLPFYIRYFTCQVNASGHLIFDQDIYGYDSLQEKQAGMNLQD